MYERTTGCSVLTLCSSGSTRPKKFARWGWRATGRGRNGSSSDP